MKRKKHILRLIIVGALSVLATCSAPSLSERAAAGENALALGKVSGRQYLAAENSIQILFNNPWVPLDECTGTVAETSVCDVAAGKSPEQTDNNADARAINSVVANLIRQSAIDVIEGYLPQNIHLDVASQNLDNNRIIEALEFAIENGVHVRFVGNREDDDFDYSGGSETESDNDEQFKPVKDYDASDEGFGDIAKALDEYYPINVSGTAYEREEFPLAIGTTEFDGDYSTYDGLNPGVIHRFFFIGRTNTSNNLGESAGDVSDFNLLNHTGQMHHKFMLIKTRKRDKAGLPVTSNGNPVIEYHVVSGSTNLTDNGFYRNNNNIIIFTEEREYSSTDTKDDSGATTANGWPDKEEIVITSGNNRCPLDNPDDKPCLYNTYKRQMNYLLSDYNEAYKPAANAPLKNYSFKSGTTLDVYFSDYQSDPIIPRITDEALKAQSAIYFMAFSFSTATKANDSGVKLHEALGPKHPLRGLIDIRGLMSPGRTENLSTISALALDARITEYDNGSRDPDFYLGANRLHHKTMIIDPCDSSATVITGSANWSQTVDGREETSATFTDPHAEKSSGTALVFNKGTYNNEDIIIINSQEVAEIYYEQEFRHLVGQSNQSGWLDDLPLCN